jgi:hypothetical protein
LVCEEQNREGKRGREGNDEFAKKEALTEISKLLNVTWYGPLSFTDHLLDGSCDLRSSLGYIIKLFVKKRVNSAEL